MQHNKVHACRCRGTHGAAQNKYIYSDAIGGSGMVTSLERTMSRSIVRRRPLAEEAAHSSSSSSRASPVSSAHRSAASHCQRSRARAVRKRSRSQRVLLLLLLLQLQLMRVMMMRNLTVPLLQAPTWAERDRWSKGALTRSFDESESRERDLREVAEMRQECITSRKKSAKQTPPGTRILHRSHSPPAKHMSDLLFWRPYICNSPPVILDLRRCFISMSHSFSFSLSLLCTVDDK